MHLAAARLRSLIAAGLIAAEALKVKLLKNWD